MDSILYTLIPAAPAYHDRWKNRPRNRSATNSMPDNNAAERGMRPIGIGRRNWLFVGNETSANKAMLFYSLIQTCKLNNIDVRKYLTYVLGKTHDMRNGSLSPRSLLPQFINPELVS